MIGIVSFFGQIKLFKPYFYGILPNLRRLEAHKKLKNKNIFKALFAIFLRNFEAEPKNPQKKWTKKC